MSEWNLYGPLPAPFTHTSSELFCLTSIQEYGQMTEWTNPKSCSSKTSSHEPKVTALCFEEMCFSGNPVGFKWKKG